jgi:hypothetical protein
MSAPTLPSLAELEPEPVARAPVPPVISVSTGVLAAVAKWANPDEVRLHLRLVVFRDRELIATDGHRLVRVPCETHGYTFGVDRAHLLAAASAQRELGVARPHVIEISPDEPGRIQLRLTGPYALTTRRDVRMTVPAGRVDDYPPIEQVMPTPSKGVSPQGYVMDPRYLAAIEEVTAAMHPEAGRGVTLAAWCAPDAAGDLLGPMLFTNAGGARFVIMPMRAP